MLRSRASALLLVAAALVSAPGLAYAELVGDPEAAAQYWGRQHYDDCTMMAVADVVGQITGAKPTEDELIALAAATPNGEGSGPIYSLPTDEAEGTAARKLQLPNIRDLPVLLERYGIGSVYTNDAVAADGGLPTGIPALEEDLAVGKKVIASVNGETIWDTPGDRSVHNHALVVTGIEPGGR